MATKKIRVYELARELGVENEVVLDLANELKIGVKSHSSSIEDPMADRVRRLADSKGLRQAPIEEPAPPPKAPAKAAAPKPAQAAPSVARETLPDSTHRVVRSTGGLPDAEPAGVSSGRVIRSTGGIPEPPPPTRDAAPARPATPPTAAVAAPPVAAAPAPAP